MSQRVGEGVGEGKREGQGGGVYASERGRAWKAGGARVVGSSLSWSHLLPTRQSKLLPIGLPSESLGTPESGY